MSINSDYSLWFILPCLLASYFVTVYFYAKNEWFKQQSKPIRLLLKGLRTSVIFLLFLLLIGLIFQHTLYRKEKPVLITLVDNSASMLSYNDSSQIQKQISALQAKIKTESMKAKVFPIDGFDEG